MLGICPDCVEREWRVVPPKFVFTSVLLVWPDVNGRKRMLAVLTKKISARSLAAGGLYPWFWGLSSLAIL